MKFYIRRARKFPCMLAESKNHKNPAQALIGFNRSSFTAAISGGEQENVGNDVVFKLGHIPSNEMSQR